MIDKARKGSLTFQAYSDLQFDTFVHRPDNLTYAIMGVAGEAGEVIEAYNKIMRIHGPDELTYDEKAKLLDELGDLLWYISKVAKLLGSDLGIVACMNINKLADRRENGKKEN